MKYYAGIGSRETPTDVLATMKLVAKFLSRHNYCLRSGGAPGADEAFEETAVYKQIYLPWSGFQDKRPDGDIYIVPPLNTDLVAKYHPAPERLSKGALALMSRNSYQVLGLSLDDPVDFIVCWTKDGKASGGTGQALRIAQDRNIPIFNLYHGKPALIQVYERIKNDKV